MVRQLVISVLGTISDKAHSRMILRRKSSTKHPYLIITTYGLVASGPSDFVTEYSFFDYVVLDGKQQSSASVELPS